MILSEKIKAIRTHKKLSQKEVALSVGIDRGQYSRFETGKVEPSLPTLRKIATALDIKISDLFSEEKPLDINSFDEPLIERLRLIDALEAPQKEVVYGMIDIALANKKLKDVLANAMSIAS